MTPDRRERLSYLLAEGQSLANAELGAFLERECGRDRELRAHLERLLVEGKRASELFEAPFALRHNEIGVPIPYGILSPNDVIADQFVINSLVGSGGMGEVYLASDRRLQRKVAIKILPARLHDDPDRRQRFEREARAIAALHHPHICDVYQFGSDRDRDYIVLEYLEGETLAQRIRRGGLSNQEWNGLAMEITSALAYAHANGVVHRDLKPANIMLTSDGAKLLDFGLAKHISPSHFKPEDSFACTETMQTGHGVLIGTVSYMSPEQAEGKHLDARSDIFSLGCVLYEAITAKRAFEGDSFASTLAPILTKEPSAIPELAPGCPTNVAQIILGCLQKNPAKRFQKVEEIQHLLQELTPSDNGSAKGIRRLRQRWPSLVTKMRETLLTYPLAAGAVIAGLLAISLGPTIIRQAKPNGAREGIYSLAVLPFANVSNDPDLEYLVDGLSESVTNELSRASHLRVIARTTAFSYKGRNPDVRRVAKELKVRGVVTGRVSPSHHQLRVQADLIDGTEGIEIWGQKYEGTLDDMLSIEQGLIRELIQNLPVAREGKDATPDPAPPTHEPKAYHLYLKGRHAIARYDVADIRGGIDYFREALTIDPRYALAFAGLADSYWSLSGMYMHPREAMPKARAAAERALEIDPSLAEAHIALGVVDGFYSFDWDKSVAEMKRAIVLNPNSAAAHFMYAYALVSRGHFEAGLFEANRAHELDPLSAFVETGLAECICYSGKCEDAAKRLQNVIQSDVNFSPAHQALGRVYLSTHQYAEAIRELENAARLDPSAPIPMGYLAYAHGMLGNRREGLAYLTQLKKAAATRYVSSTVLAIASLPLEGADQAFIWLRQAYEDRDDMVGWLKVDPLFEQLRSDNRYSLLMHKIGLDH